MAKRRNRGNGSGSIFKRRDDGPYCISWYDASGKRREHNCLTTDKQAAERILADKLAAVALRRDGIIDARMECLSIQSQRSIEDHLADFEAMMAARQRTVPTGVERATRLPSRLTASTGVASRTSPVAGKLVALSFPRPAGTSQFRPEEAQP